MSCSVFTGTSTQLGSTNPFGSTMRHHTRVSLALAISGLLPLLQIYHMTTMTTPQRDLRLIPVLLPKIPHKCPQSTSRAALCVVVKDEEAYLDEFINYHWALGFDTLYLYDNADFFEMAQWGRQKQAALQMNSNTRSCSGRQPQQLHVQHVPGAGRQMELFESCARTAQDDRHTWAAFFDVDEYLVLRDQEHVVDYLQHAMKSGGSLAIPWVEMTTAAEALRQNGTPEEERRVTYSPVPLTRRYQYRQVSGRSRHIKTIATLADVDHSTPRHNPHVVPLQPGAVQRNVWGQVTEGPTEQIDPAQPLGPAALYHYGTKSYKEYYRKRQRGRATVIRSHKSNQKLLAQAKELLREQPKSSGGRVVYDPTAWQHLQRLIPTYTVWNDPAWSVLVPM